MRHLSLAGAALLAVLLAGCTSTVGPEESPQNDDSTPPASAPAELDCSGLTTEHLQDVFGVELRGPDEESDSSDDDGVERTVHGCDWESVDGKLDIDFDYSAAADFAGGTVECVEPSGAGDTVTAVDDIGEQAWWVTDDDNDVSGELRVCTGDALAELDVDADDNTTMTRDELRDMAVEALRAVVA
ncbi:hypothetical protein FVA74_01910 [Salinibacterium sp. dk2585]|uniref:hypothetical protein n=1 Tax=unclassified Salinibacterium TaxID=2632331 RepID=UPI0011C24F9E|nr:MULTISPECIES: hypothetical protein [unclassified Salinibacterium]QEE60462.1 hypothetical protein FVA74_01910 [Salinibacterium sp. dk2585]TXK55535.1 hypothetical protein FVP63_02055 [Salinibacterium sp. dk5596]